MHLEPMVLTVMILHRRCPQGEGICSDGFKNSSESRRFNLASMRVRPTGVAAVGKNRREQLINHLETCQSIDDADVLISSDKGEGGLCHKDSLRLPYRSEVVDSHKWPLMRIGKPGHSL